MSIVGDQQKVGHFVPKTCQIFKVCLSPSICMGSTSSSLYSVIYLYHHQILTNNWINVTFALWYRFFLLLFSWSSVLLTCVCVSCLPFPMLANLYQCTVHLQTRKKNVCIQGVQLWSLLLIVHVWLQIACPFYIFIFSWFHSISHFFFRTASLPWSQSFHFISCSLYILLVSAFNVQMRRQIFQFGFQWSMPLDCRLLRLIVIFHCVVYPSL